MTALLDTAAIAAILGVSREHVTDRLTKRPDFPAPIVNISRKLRRWDEVEVMAWRDRGVPKLPPEPPPLMPTYDAIDMQAFLRGVVRQAQRRSTRKRRPNEVGYLAVCDLFWSQQGCCAVSGMLFDLNREATSLVRPFAPSLDRLDSKRGYVAGNVRLVCHCVNLMMNEWGDAVYRKLAQNIGAAASA